MPLCNLRLLLWHKVATTADCLMGTTDGEATEQQSFSRDCPAPQRSGVVTCVDKRRIAHLKLLQLGGGALLEGHHNLVETLRRLRRHLAALHDRPRVAAAAADASCGQNLVVHASDAGAQLRDHALYGAHLRPPSPRVQCVHSPNNLAGFRVACSGTWGICLRPMLIAHVQTGQRASSAAACQQR